MDYTHQQKQTKEFFEKHWDEWDKNAKLMTETSVNVVELRNQFVERICSSYLTKGARTLDAGCGTGDLVISLLKKGYDSMGVDFASSMIEKAKKDALKSNLPENKFLACSILDFEPETKFDLISANGLIEYISPQEYDEFVKRSFRFLNNKGIVTIESRNRLFNVFSFNKYTQAEVELNQVAHLIEECILFNSVKTLDELLQKKFKVELLENLHQHEFTGNEFINIKVDKRYQYTPFQLITKLQENGFEVLEIQPIHIHGITTGAKSNDPKVHTYVSYYLQDKKNIHLNLIPQASSFMIAARKK